MTAIDAQVATDSPMHGLRWWTFAVVSVTVLIATIDETILNVALRSLQRDLGASASELQWMVNSILAVFGGLLLTMGGLGDRFGRARCCVTGSRSLPLRRSARRWRIHRRS